MTLREKFAKDDPDNYIGLAACLLAAYECGDKGFNPDDPAFIARFESLAAMTDEQFDKEHKRILFEFDTQS
jgi:hypothetical protein